MDSFTGTKMTRPEFDKLLEELKAGDTLVVAKLDRFARSVSQASDLITKLIDDGIRVNVCNLGWISLDHTERVKQCCCNYNACGGRKNPLWALFFCSEGPQNCSEISV